MNQTAPTLKTRKPVDIDENEFAIPEGEGVLDPPRKFLEDYLSATKWEDLKAKSLGDDDIKKQMAAYYKSNPYKVDTGVEVSFQHKQKLPDSPHQFYLFKVSTDAFRKRMLDNGAEPNEIGFPMTVEETSNGFRTDWVTYVQFKDSHLQNFIENPKVGKGGKGETKTFNVILRRAHYFLDEVPDSDDKWCFRVNSPVVGEEGGWVFIPKFSKYAQDLDKKLKWAYTYFPIVEIRWETDSSNPQQPYLRVVKVKQFNWRSHEEQENPLASTELN